MSMIVNPYWFGAIGASIIDPTTVTGNKIWLKGDDAALSGASDGTTVASWTNHGGAGGTFNDNGSSSVRPTYRTSGPNGKPYFEFPTTGKSFLSDFTLGNYLAASAWTIFLVIRPQAAGPAGSPTWTNTGFMKDGDDRWQVNDASSKFGVQMYPDGTDSGLTYGSAFSLNTWYIVDITLSSGTGSLKVNGGTAVTGTLFNITSLANPLRIGAKVFDLAEFQSWNVGVGSSDMTALRSSLATKYAITIT